jgi:hypothetical protein
MVFLAARMVDLKANLKNIVYPITCMIIAVGTIFFMYMNVR